MCLRRQMRGLHYTVRRIALAYYKRTEYGHNVGLVWQTGYGHNIGTKFRKLDADITSDLGLANWIWI